MMARRTVTPEERVRRSTAAKFAAFCRERKARFYIAFTVCRTEEDRSKHPSDWRRYRSKAVWPVLFYSREEAEEAMSLLPVLTNAAPTDTRGRIISASVERVRK